jgi:exonuclease SbcC
MFAEQEVKVNELLQRVADLEEMAAPLVKEKLAESIQRHRAVSKRVYEAEAKYNKAISDKQLRDKEISIIKSELEKLEIEFEGLSTILSSSERKEFNNKKLLLEALAEDLEARERELRDLFVDLGGKNEKLKQLTKEKSACRADLEKIRIYETVQQAFSKNGIPAMVLKAQLPAINMELCKILGNVVDFTVSLETDISSNTMDVYLEDRQSRRLIETASGMEKTISSLALRIALNNLSSLSRPDILILDESFSALDEENLAKVLPFLQILKSYFKSILIISHLLQVKETSEIIIEVANDGIYSKVCA